MYGLTEQLRKQTQYYEVNAASHVLGEKITKACWQLLLTLAAVTLNRRTAPNNCPNQRIQPNLQVRHSDILKTPTLV